LRKAVVGAEVEAELALVPQERARQGLVVAKEARAHRPQAEGMPLVVEHLPEPSVEARQPARWAVVHRLAALQTVLRLPHQG
jgi:hypothetical protein